MKFIIFFVACVSILSSQSKQICEGEYESILHDKNTPIHSSSLSRLNAETKGYVFSIVQENNQIIITQNGRKESYIRYEKDSHKYFHKNKSVYLVKNKNTDYYLYMYSKDKLITFGCRPSVDTLSNEVTSYSTFSHHIEPDQEFLFEKENLIVMLSDTDPKKENERIVTYWLASDPSYIMSLWCGRNNEGYLESLLPGEVVDENLEYYSCSDPEGKMQIKIDTSGFYAYSDFLTVGKEVIENGYPDLDRKFFKTVGEKFIKGILVQ